MTGSWEGATWCWRAGKGEINPLLNLLISEIHGLTREPTFFFSLPIWAAPEEAKTEAETVELFRDKFQVGLGQVPLPPSTVLALPRIHALSPEGYLEPELASSALQCEV